MDNESKRHLECHQDAGVSGVIVECFISGASVSLPFLVVGYDGRLIFLVDLGPWLSKSNGSLIVCEAEVTRPNEVGAEVYQLHVWIRQSSPMIWRRLLVRSDSTIAELHDTLQMAFGWSDAHLDRFYIHGQDYGVYHDGGIGFSSDADRARLCEFKFRTNERFRYKYNFGDGWQHEVRVDARLAQDEKRTYSWCIGGKRRAPPRKTVAGLSPLWRAGMRSRRT
ncbi:plasmid pRiA4b ORF-3 family protein [Mycetohabitans rhizoxinica]|uniref:Plasmid pRiA4b ORF-3 family protein n=1 Tax=Mycetohabitans rhizoxinica TaxID=412963 RepID=A0ABZ2Q023_9BURK